MMPQVVERGCWCETLGSWNYYHTEVHKTTEGFCRCRRLKTKNKVSEISATQQLNMSMEISGEEPTPGNNNIIVRPYTRTLLWRVITTVYERMAPLLDVDQHNFDLGTGQRTWNTGLQFASFSMKSCFCGTCSLFFCVEICLGLFNWILSSCFLPLLHVVVAIHLDSKQHIKTVATY